MKDTNSGYLVKRVGNKIKYVHRLIMGARDNEIVDHINGNTLDNRKQNLRIVSKSQNNRNRHSLGYTRTKYGKYQVDTSIQNKKIFIGNYSDENDAAIVAKAVRKLAFVVSTGIKINSKEIIKIGNREYDKNEVEKALENIKSIN